MVKNSSQPNLNPAPSTWQSLPLPQKNQLINLVYELVQHQLTKQKQLKGAVMNAVLPNRSINQLDNSGKIKSQHLSRKAIIYIRQSTMQQVHRHQESTRLQYGLVDRVILLYFTRSKIAFFQKVGSVSGVNYPVRAYCLT